ncbi:MAG: glycine--tRNA ligase [Candidatus Lokiarchaeota archaeon]|nr:glycine--tRNA ligase [Candidatus Lokiarchaeota archaeon]
MQMDNEIDALNSLIIRRGFIWGPSPEIYGGVSGFYEYGPAGTLLKNNILKIFRQNLLYEDFWEIDCPNIMPREVWEASGHIDRFIDPVTQCMKCNSLYRVDKLIKELLPDETPDGLSFEELDKLLSNKELKCPSCGGDLGTVTSYNLMLKMMIAGSQEAYLRPETATTTYLTFKRLYRDFRQKLPIQVYQFGKAYRNEISPRQGLIRLREFNQFECQIFLTKEQEFDFEGFNRLKDTKIPLVPWSMQKKKEFEPLWITLEEAYQNKYLKKPAYAYCLGLAYIITKEIGFKDEIIRFRQHSTDEKAHYADDAWDLEINTRQYGWIEICGVHDRTNYDLRRHQEYSNEKIRITKNKKKIIPEVLEIAFGIERPVYAIIDQSITIDEEYDRILLKLPKVISPIRAAIFPLIKKEEKQVEIAKKIHRDLLEKGLYCKYDESGSIGKRYRRQDELGTPYAITVDHQSVKDKTVTIRDRDTTEQKRVKIENIFENIKTDYD